MSQVLQQDVTYSSSGSPMQVLEDAALQHVHPNASAQGQLLQLRNLPDTIEVNSQIGAVSDDSFSVHNTFGAHQESGQTAPEQIMINTTGEGQLFHQQNPLRQSRRHPAVSQLQPLDSNGQIDNISERTQSPRQEEIKEDEVTQMMTGHHRQITIQQNPLVHQNNTSQALNMSYNRVQAIV